MSVFHMGEWVLLVSQKGKKWLVKIEDAPFSSHIGTIQMGDIVGKEEGEHLITNKGARLFVFRASLEEYIYKMKRLTQVIYPKDLGAMVFYGDLKPGDVVLESGIGSGALTLALLRAVGERGRVISVEKRPEFAELATENIVRFLGSSPSSHNIIVADIQGFTMKLMVDCVFLDLPEPWWAVASVGPLLRQGGLLVSLSPNVGQIQLMHRELRKNGFANITTFELLRREWKVDDIRARPMDRMIAHTGFITVAKKVPATYEEPPREEE